MCPAISARESASSAHGCALSKRNPRAPPMFPTSPAFITDLRLLMVNNGIHTKFLRPIRLLQTNRKNNLVRHSAES
jgi:hypothetical protein